MPQKRHTVDLVVAKLREADVDVCMALTHSGAASVAATSMWIGVRAWLDNMTNQGLITLVLF